MRFVSLRLVANVLALPVACAIIAVLLSMYISTPRNDIWSAAITPIAEYLRLAAVAFATAHMAWRGVQILRAMYGFGELCHHCGMPTKYIHRGRYGPYLRCIACGTNRRA